MMFAAISSIIAGVAVIITIIVTTFSMGRKMGSMGAKLDAVCLQVSNHIRHDMDELKEKAVKNANDIEWIKNILD